MQVELVKTPESNFQESEVSKTLVRHLRTALGSCTSVHCILCISYAMILMLHPLQPQSLLELIGYAGSDLVCPYL
jgi:hypothetical protein